MRLSRALRCSNPRVLQCATEQRRARKRSEPQRHADGDHRCASGVDGLDDLAAVDALQVNGRDAEVALAELALDDDQRYAFARHFDGVGVPELVGRKAAPHSGRGSGAPQLGTCRGRRPLTSARGAVDDAQQRTDWKLPPDVKPRLQLFPTPCVHADFATASALAAPHQDRAPALVEIPLGESEPSCCAARLAT